MAAAAASTISSGSSFEVLTGFNYERWSVLMKNYLIGEGLWDDIISGHIVDRDSEDWRRRNAKALYAIQLSCGPDIFKSISKIDDARDAWSHLSSLASPGAISHDADAHSNTREITRDSEARGPQSDPDPNKQGIPICDLSLRRCVEKGDWIAAKYFIRMESEAVFSRDSSGRTVLHAAVMAGHVEIVKKLVSGQDERDLIMQDYDGYTALALVAQLNGYMGMAECMVDKNPDLLIMKTKDGQIPLLLASAMGYKALTQYLYHKTPESLLTENQGAYGIMLFVNCITAGIIDVALNLLQSGPWFPLSVKDLRYEGYNRMPPLLALANMPSIFRSGCRLNWWQGPIYAILRPQYEHPRGWINIKIISHAEPEITTLPGIKEVYEKKVTHCLVLTILICLRDRVDNFDESQLRENSAYEAMLQAAKYGITEFIESMTEANPELLRVTDKNKRSIFSYVILNRQEKLTHLLLRNLIGQDVFGNNVLHQAAELGPPSDLDSRFGAALQMQREIQWFKKIEKMAPPMCKEATNAKGRKPHEVFTESHKDLVEAGEKWAKDSAQSFTIVCTLIITITFAAAFTVPGGNSQDTGFPMFLKKTLFEVFIMADAVSLVTSSSSVLLSIVILTSRQTEQDFLTRLPLMLMLNLLFLFMSVVAMMVAFCAGIAMMLKGYRNLVIAAISLASLPVIVFVRTQFPLFFKIAISTIDLEWFTYMLLLPYRVVIFMLVSPCVMIIYLIKMIKAWVCSPGTCFLLAKYRRKRALGSNAWTE